MKNKLFGILVLFTIACTVFGHSEKAMKLYKEGVLENKKGRLVNASVLFTNAVADSPEFADAYYQRALSFQGMGEFGHAIKDLEQATQLNIDNINAYLLLMRLHKNEKNFEAALTVTERILKNLPDNAAGAYYDQAKIYEELGKLLEASAAYRQSLKYLDPDMKDFKIELENSIARVEQKAKK